MKIYFIIVRFIIREIEHIVRNFKKKSYTVDGWLIFGTQCIINIKKQYQPDTLLVTKQSG